MVSIFVDIESWIDLLINSSEEIGENDRLELSQVLQKCSDVIHKQEKELTIFASTSVVLKTTLAQHIGIERVDEIQNGVNEIFDRKENTKKQSKKEMWCACEYWIDNECNRIDKECYKKWYKEDSP